MMEIVVAMPELKQRLHVRYYLTQYDTKPVVKAFSFGQKRVLQYHRHL